MCTIFNLLGLAPWVSKVFSLANLFSMPGPMYMEDAGGTAEADPAPPLPYILRFERGIPMPDLNGEPPEEIRIENPSADVFYSMIKKEASPPESGLPDDGGSSAVRHLLSNRPPDLNQTPSLEKEGEKAALVEHIKIKASEYLQVKGDILEEFSRKLGNRQRLADTWAFLKKIPDYLSDRKKRKREEDDEPGSDWE